MIRISLLLALLTAPLAAAALDGDRVEALVEQALTQARQSGHAVLSQHRRFPACPTSPRVSSHNGGWQAVLLSCDAGGWRRVIRIHRGQAAPRRVGQDNEALETFALVLNESLPRGTILGVRHLDKTSIPATGQTDLVASLETAIGRRLKVNLGVGQALLGRHLDHDWQVEKEASVTIVSGTGPISIKTAGVALEHGQLGQDIRVSNAVSGQIVHVVVTGPNKVKVRPNMR